MLLLILTEPMDFSWPQLALWGPTIIILVIVLGFLLKVLPTWKELKLLDFSIREAEAKAKSEQAASLGHLGEGITVMSETLKEIAVEQRRATDAVKILQRVNADTSDQMTRHLAILTDRVERIERGQANVEPHGSETKPH